MLIENPSFRLSKLWLGAFIFWSSQTVAAPKVVRGAQQPDGSVELIDGANYIATFNGKILPGLIGYSAGQGGFAIDESEYLESDISSEDVRKLKRIISHLDYRRCRNGCHLEVKSYRVVADKGARSIFIRDPHGDYLALHRSSRAIGTPLHVRHLVSSSYRPTSDRVSLRTSVLPLRSMELDEHQAADLVRSQQGAQSLAARKVVRNAQMPSLRPFVGDNSQESDGLHLVRSSDVNLPISLYVERRGITPPVLTRVSMAGAQGGPDYVATFNGRTLPGLVGYDAEADGLVVDEGAYLENSVPAKDVEVLKRIVSQLDYQRCRDGCHLELKSFRVVVDKGARSIFIRDARGDYVALHKSSVAGGKRPLTARASPHSYRAANGNERVDRAPLPLNSDVSTHEEIVAAAYAHGETSKRRNATAPRHVELPRISGIPTLGSGGEATGTLPAVRHDVSNARPAASLDALPDSTKRSRATASLIGAGEPVRDEDLLREQVVSAGESGGHAAGAVRTWSGANLGASARNRQQSDYRHVREDCYSGTKNCRLITYDGMRPLPIRDSRDSYSVSRASRDESDAAGEAPAESSGAVDDSRSEIGRHDAAPIAVRPAAGFRSEQLGSSSSHARGEKLLSAQGIELGQKMASGSSDSLHRLKAVAPKPETNSAIGGGQLADLNLRMHEPVPQAQHESGPGDETQRVPSNVVRSAATKAGTGTIAHDGQINANALPSSRERGSKLAQAAEVEEMPEVPQRAHAASSDAGSNPSPNVSSRAGEDNAPDTSTKGLKVSYGVPDGFSAADLDNSASYVSTFNGKTLPGLVSYSRARGELTFDDKAYLENGISGEDIEILKRVLSRLNYKQCRKGCDVKIDGYYVTIDKAARSIAIRDASADYIAPPTSFGIVNNQVVDLRAATDGYRTFNVTGGTWVGMPSQSFGFLSWYVNETHSRQYQSSTSGLSSYYLQKNFANTYIRAGRQSSLDYSSNAVSTLIAPSFDQFVTFGSQSHLDVNDTVGSLILYANADGNYEFYRDGRLVLKRPASIGRNQISFADLPGGYYSVEVRLVDRNGNIVSREIHEINNLNFGGPNSGNAWHVTAGKDMYTGGYLVEGAMSRNLKQFYLNSSILVGQNGRWAAEMNMTRPTQIAGLDIAPTLGVLSGERSFGGYANVSVSNERFGSLTVSRYQNTNVSRFYRGQPSTALAYSRVIRKATFSYNYQQSGFGQTHQAEVRWNYRPNGLWATFALGLQKGGFRRDNNGYGVYFNMTITLDKVQGSFGAAHSSGQTQLNADVRKDFQDNFGVSTVGMNANRTGNDYGVNLYGSRSGTRGDISLNLGNTRAATNVDFNYRGAVAAGKAGLALGRYSPSGTAMLLTTPKIGDMHYGFNVEGSPVAGNSKYIVPLNAYADVSFARVFSNSHDLDMNIEVPANIVRAHPGQVYSAKANVDINMIYSGFLTDAAGNPISGTIIETQDRVYRNGLFSIVSKRVLPSITVKTDHGEQYRCDLKKSKGSYFRCTKHQPITNAKVGE